MTHANRTIAALALLGLLMPGLGEVVQSQGITRKTLTISGSTGLADVTMQGLPDNPVSDKNGVYSARVPYGWSGTAAPTKPGYRFEPPAKKYSSVTADLMAENYVAQRLTYVISGTAGVPGVVIQGLPGSVYSDVNGAYSARLEYGWSGVVKPEKPGFRFEPSSRMYSKVTEDRKSEDYNPSLITFTISGKTGVAGVTMKGLPGDPVTDRQGSYAARVDYGWSGAVTPVKKGYEFKPGWREYPPVMEGLTHEDYTAQVLTYRISGNVGLPGVGMKGLPGDPVSAADGSYSAEVPYGWSGTVTPEREGVQFGPWMRVHQKVGADLSGQDYKVLTIRDLPPSTAGAPEILVIPTWEVDLKDFAETREDMQVMLHILREKLSEPRMILGVLNDYGDFFGGGRDIQATYLQGYAALFVMEVDFPFSFPSEPRGEGEPKEKEPVDPVWQRARQRLYAPPGAMRYGTSRQRSGTDQVSFEQFKEDLVETLKHAANIRNIEPNEWVIVTVVGRGEQGLGVAPSGRGMGGMMGGGGWVGGSGYSAGGGSFGGGGAAFGGGGGFYTDSRSSSGAPRVWPGSPLGSAALPSVATTVLTIQAKKADIDAFAKGDMDLEQFRQKVRVFTY